MLLIASLLGLAVTSSSMVGVALGLYARLSQRHLAAVLAFAAGLLISALAIELGFETAQALHHRGFGSDASWAIVGSGFAIGAIIYYGAALYLEGKGAAVRYPTRFREFADQRHRQEVQELTRLLSQCDLLRHLPAEQIGQLLRSVRRQNVAAETVLFRGGDPGDALYIIAGGEIEILGTDDGTGKPQQIARLGAGQAFGEMALLHGGQRTATARAIVDTQLLVIDKRDFDRLVAEDPQLAMAVERLSHGRALSNLSIGGPEARNWAKLASSTVDRVSRYEANRLLEETGSGAGLAIVFGNILDTIPGCLVIGAKFTSLEDISLSLALGMFIGGIPEAAASAAMLRRAGYRARSVFGLWSTVLIAGVIAAAVGKGLLASSDALPALVAQAIAGGAVLALVVHAMVPEAIEEAGSLIVLPTVAGFLFGLYFSLADALG